MKTGRNVEARRTRLPPQVRRDQIINAAAGIALKQGHLPLRLEDLARAAGVSKALIYAYFPTQFDLFNALLDREFQALAARGLVEAARRDDLEAAALGCALAYFDHVAAAGPLIHVILRDPYMAHQVSPAVAGWRDRLVRRIASLARRELLIGARENIASISMVTTIPEEAGRLAYSGELSFEHARELCRQLVLSSIAAFRPGVV
jgi:AcrR family transcriptional regulator